MCYEVIKIKTNTVAPYSSTIIGKIIFKTNETTLDALIFLFVE